jgi:RimJ/RimL family protein N-acetyltransferase
MLRIRSVTDEDCRLLWEWANDPDVRASSFESEPIPWEEHVTWFRAKRADPNCYMYIILDQDDRPIGQVRFDIQSGSNAEAVISIGIARDQRGRGYGVEALRLACGHFLKATGTKPIVAYIKLQNMASIRAFEKAGFVHHDITRVKGHEAARMILRREQS